MRRYSDAAAEVSNAAQSPPARANADPHACNAYGCPQAGSVAASTRGEGPWWCWWHYVAFTRGEDLQPITADIRAGKLPDNRIKLRSAWADDNRHLVKRDRLPMKDIQPPRRPGK